MTSTLLRTARLDVRRWRDADAPRVLDLHSRPEVVRWLGDDVAPMRTLAQARERIAGDNAVADHPPRGHWAVEVRETGVVAGSVMLVALPGEAERVQVGWHLHPDSTGRGYAREAAAAVLQRGLRQLPEVLALTHLDNYPSQRVALAIGMVEVGLTERWYAGPSRLFRAVPGTIAAAPRP